MNNNNTTSVWMDKKIIINKVNRLIDQIMVKVMKLYCY